jgi:hypothetical protein
MEKDLAPLLNQMECHHQSISIIYYFRNQGFLMFKIKKIEYLFITLIFLVISIKAYAQNPGDNIFSGIKVFNININFYYPNYWDSLTYYYELGTELCIPTDVIIDGDTLVNVGIRFKGNSSYSHPNDKKSLRLGFDEFDGVLRWDGLKGIHLNNCYGDPTFMREKIYLDFCKDAGIIAPRANFAKVSFNDTTFAFYSLIEHVDKIFLDTRFGNKNGDLFKAVDDFGTANLVSDFKWYTAVEDSYYTRYELKTDGSLTAYPQLINLLDSLNNGSNLETSLPNLVNLNGLYNSIAADIIFANLDSYINSGRNFYFYFNTATNKMEWVKWDVGLSFGDFSGGVSNFENLNVSYILNSNERPLWGKILNTPSFKSNYLNSLCFLNTNSLNTTNIFKHIDSVANIIRSFVYADSRKQYTNNQFELNILSDLAISGVGGTTRIPGLKSFLTARKNSINTQLTTLGIDCSATNIEEAVNSLPEEFVLKQNFPNPFNPATIISFSIGKPEFVTLKIYDILGSEVATLFSSNLNQGNYNFNFDASSFSSGVYLYRLQTESFNQSKQMILLK